jgi:hypothetical protein
MGIFLSEPSFKIMPKGNGHQHDAQRTILNKSCSDPLNVLDRTGPESGAGSCNQNKKSGLETTFPVVVYILRVRDDRRSQMTIWPSVDQRRRQVYRYALLAACSLIMTVGVSAQICAPASAQTTSSTNEDAHRQWTEDNIAQLRKDIGVVDSKTDKMSIDNLTKLIDLHNKYEDYIVKSAQAQHASIQVYGTMGVSIFSAVALLVGGLIGTFVTWRISRGRTAQ